jgi:hypothetical protein
VIASALPNCLAMIAFIGQCSIIRIEAARSRIISRLCGA